MKGVPSAIYGGGGRLLNTALGKYIFKVLVFSKNIGKCQFLAKKLTF